MPLARIEIEQVGNHQWVVEFEGAGVSARRVQHRAESFDAIVTWLLAEYQARSYEPPKREAASEVRGIDESLLPPPPPKPVTRGAAMRARREADEAVDRADPGLADRREDMRNRRL